MLARGEDTTRVRVRADLWADPVVKSLASALWSGSGGLVVVAVFISSWPCSGRVDRSHGIAG